MNPLFKILISIIPFLNKKFYNTKVICVDEIHNDSVIKEYNVHVKEGSKKREAVWLEKDFKNKQDEPCPPRSFMQIREMNPPFDLFGGYFAYCRIVNGEVFWLKPSTDFKKLQVLDSNGFEKSKLALKSIAEDYKVRNDEVANKMNKALTFIGILFCVTIFVTIGMSLYFAVAAQMDYKQFVQTVPGSIRDAAKQGIIDGFDEIGGFADDLIPEGV